MMTQKGFARTILIGFLMVGVLILMSGCADAVNVEQCLPQGRHICDFWCGIWHGMTMWFSLVGSILSNKIAIYAVSNNGFWYNFGFVGGFWWILKMIINLIKNR